MSDGSRHSVAFIRESTFGTTPTTPTFQNVRSTSCNLGLTKNSSQSDELRQDRQIAHYKHGSQSVAGDLGFELSAATFDDFLESALGGTWVTDVLKAGVLRRSYTLERYFGDIQASDKPWHRYLGCEINALNLSVPTEGKVTGSFAFMGKDMTVNNALIAGATYTAATTKEVIDSFTGTVLEGGSTNGIVTEITLALQNGLAAKPVVGSKTTLQHSIGRSNLTGQVTVYFENASLLEKFINETVSTLQFTLTDGAGSSYTILIPKIKYTGAALNVSGEGPITLPMPFQALYDSSEGTNIKITRVAA
tara:strand:- start:8527 stop:9444 length:918 start_codon:yes stop_codon:yes gene_type:complete